MAYLLLRTAKKREKYKSEWKWGKNNRAGIPVFPETGLVWGPNFTRANGLPVYPGISIGEG
jgi:hypothetical protein